MREPIFRYYHKVESSAEQRKAESHGSPLVTKRLHDGERYLVTLSFPDLPDILCLDEEHSRFKGVTLEEALRGPSTVWDRIDWGHEHFITAVWEGTQVLKFEKSYRRLKEILGDKFPTKPLPEQRWGNPMTETLREIAAALDGDIQEPTHSAPLPF